MRRAEALGGLIVTAALASSCAPSESEERNRGAEDGAGGAGAGGAFASSGGSGGTLSIDGGVGTGGAAGAAVGPQRDPVTCEEAVTFRTYLGCEYFPTVLGNVVSDVFDYAVIVANAGDVAADVHVDGPNGFTLDASVAPHQLATLYLPWVPELKGPSLSTACASEAFAGSVLARGGAYHLTSSRPVAAYQFSPLEFRAAGGPAGKVWTCDPNTSPLCECNSYSNDASLLLPINALTSNYLAFTWRDEGNPNSSKPAYVAITAVVDGTEVTVQLGPSAELQPGPEGSGIPSATAGGVFSLTLDRGDVAELVAVAGTDLSGTQIQAAGELPIQVMAGSPSATVPNDGVRSSDHIEEIVFPAESVGRDYVVTVPTGPFGQPVSHVVRLYGHALPTTLSYFPATPPGAPATLEPARVAEFQVSADFQVQGTEPFAVGSFLVGGQQLDPDSPAQNSSGDPSQSLVTTFAQYRNKYVFLAPIDYESNFVDIVAPDGASLTLDGMALDPATSQSFAGTNTDASGPRTFAIYRVPLDAGPSFLGAHELVASKPVGIQVVGYGRFTSYQYPGGLNLNLISQPPVIR